MVWFTLGPISRSFHRGIFSGDLLLFPPYHISNQILPILCSVVGTWDWKFATETTCGILEFWVYKLWCLHFVSTGDFMPVMCWMEASHFLSLGNMSFLFVMAHAIHGSPSGYYSRGSGPGSTRFKELLLALAHLLHASFRYVQILTSIWDGDITAALATNSPALWLTASLGLSSPLTYSLGPEAHCVHLCLCISREFLPA